MTKLTPSAGLAYDLAFELSGSGVRSPLQG
jgi:hypothetical protein